MVAHFHAQVWNAADEIAWDNPSSSTNLKLERAWIVYPGKRRYSLHDRVEVLPLAEIEALRSHRGLHFVRSPRSSVL